MPVVVTDREGRILNGGVPLYGDEIPVSIPPEGYKKVKEIYYNPTTNRLVVVYEA